MRDETCKHCGMDSGTTTHEYGDSGPPFHEFEPEIIDATEWWRRPLIWLRHRWEAIRRD